MRRDTLTITSTQAGHSITKTIFLRHLTGIAASSLGDSIAVCYHGDQAATYLNASECLDMIGKTWAIRNCRYYRQNACWGARQTSGLPPQGCIGCQLRLIYKDRTREDLRACLVEKPRNPLLPAFYVACAMLAEAYWFGKIGETAMIRAARAEAALKQMQATTFRRQGDKHK